MKCWALVLVLGLTATTSSAQQTCRQGKNKLPHQRNYWQDDFLIDEDVEALCEGSVTVMADGEICISGRVSYDQLAEKVGKPIFAPSAGSISVPGHLVAATGNVVRGRESGYVYDFITKYTCGGKEYTADADITNILFGASCGLITEVCFDASFAKDEELYAFKHDIWLPKNAEEDKYKDANIIYASAFAIVAEYHEPTNLSPFFGSITSTLTTFFADIVPAFVFNTLPLLGATGIFRYFVAGSVSTSKWPQPLRAPDVVVEDIQIDTEWETLLAAMRDGLFKEDLVPAYFGVLIKKISASQSSNGCWKTNTAAIDIQAPKNRGSDLDTYIEDEVLPALKAQGGNVTLHMGKRLDNGSDVLKAALETYEKCGVEMNKSPSPCYHPACTRSSSLTGFEYPDDLYQPAKGWW